MKTADEYIVVGCGGIGSAATYWLARHAGREVLGIEQFALGHDRGESQDHSRIIRLSYHDPASTPTDPRWDWVTVAPFKALPFLSLDELREMPELADSRLLARGNRLSVIPLSDAEFDAIVTAAMAKKRRRSV